MKILVTGGAGFMGSWLVDELIKRGHDVISIDNLRGGNIRNINPQCTFIEMDVRNRSKIEKICKGIDIIFHLAAYAAEGQSFFSPIQMNDININSMNSILVATVNSNVKKFIFTSSMAVYGDQEPPFKEEMQMKPVDPYGCGKAYCERMLEIFSEKFEFNYTIIRPQNVYGPRQNVSDPYRNVLMIWMNRIMRGKTPFIYGDGKQMRAFSYIEDITPALANAAFQKEAEGEIINLGSDEVVTINETCQIILEAKGSDLEPVHIEERMGEVKRAYCNIEKSRKLLGHKTNYNLKEGISRMAKWFNQISPEEPTYLLPLEIKKKAPRVWKDKLL